jgi:hypothetical protein
MSGTFHKWLTPVILGIWETEVGRITIRGQPGQILGEIPISKITRAKWTASQATSDFKHKAKSSNPSTNNNKNHTP